ncbi:prolipoprotein diacylglyceryl transferase [Konateibacter massiliensis]|uniref:prolipoprotein diacylglyceryl transferase n=1 Tax=Konateibacter massiliensis TaxID=2002841 RepID=UPI000C14F38B|nr:prolipoprotein diacylglyceryl transferase [Konateibacter massiliensis]
MYNDLFSIGPITVHSYGLLIGIGFIAALLSADYRAKKRGLDRDFLFNLAFVCIIFGLLGAKLLYFITKWKTILENPASLLELMDGFVVYGGIIGGILAAYLYCRYKKKNFLTYFDLLVPSLAIAQGFGRVGCFFAGCCYGLETTSGFSIVFQNSEYAPNHIHLVPTQLMSSLGDFAIALVLILFARKNSKSGLVASAYLVLYGIGRFIIEFFRGDLVRGSIGALSTSQFISIFIVLAGLVMGYVLNKREDKSDIEE